jgi:protein-disulfide isomerase
MSGVDWTKLEDCVNSQKYYNQILEDMADALDLGVRGTPTFFINGHKLEGAVSNEVWEQIISKYKELNKNNL